MRRRRFLGLSGAALTACSTSGLGQPSVTLTVSAAASLQEVMQDIAKLYHSQSPTVTVRYNFAASGALQRQIEQGAPVDVYISAASQQMDALEAQHLLRPQSRHNLLKNRLVLVSPKHNSTIASFQDLTQARKIALGDPETVPAGHYAKQVLTALNLYQKLENKLVFTRNVRQALTYVETGNVDAGLVYATDAQQSDAVQVIQTASPKTHAPLVYPVAVVATSKVPVVAQAFVSFLGSDVAQAVFEGYGFQMASG